MKLKLYLTGLRMHFMIISIIAMMRAYLNTYQMEKICLYIHAIVQAAYNSGLLYTTSSNREGYLI